ncbi:MAG: terminase family protein [Patescibacteria group bacterium]|jgi:hypothetical protein
MADFKQNVKLYKNSNFEILTNKGFKNFEGMMIGENHQKVKITFKSGKQLLCTPKHKIMLNDEKYLYACDLSEYDKIYNNEIVSKIEYLENNDPVYEFLEIEEVHTYIVNGILCHQCIIIDEAAHIEDHLIKDFWASVIPVISSSKKRTTKIFMTSTPKGTGNMFHEIYTKALKNEDDNNMKWHAEEVHWYDQPGRGKLWKQDMIEALHGDKMLFEQEFNCAFLETGDSAIDMDLLNDLESSCRPAYQVFEDGHYNVWKEPAPGHIYGMGVDVGEGIGKAASVIQVLDFTDLTDIQQVAVYSDRFIHPTRFADIINRVGHHFGCPPVLIERNNIGSEVIAVLKEIHQYENIVSYNPENLLYGDIRPGVLSHSNTKFNGVMNMRYWLNACKVVKLYDIASVLELKTFVRYPNGTWKKKQGDNIFDDRVMALVWCLFLLNDNIAERYYDIVEEDDNGKPLKLAAYVINQPGMFKLDPFFQQTPNAPMPSFFDMSPDDGLNELRYQGWHNLQ